jgi:hypothetical protein
MRQFWRLPLRYAILATERVHSPAVHLDGLAFHRGQAVATGILTPRARFGARRIVRLQEGN